MTDALFLEQHARTLRLLGPAALEALQKSTVAVCGLGGVGGHAAEALARSGVGRLILIDGDVVVPSNLNRQVVALHSTLGQNKALVMQIRVRDINPRTEAIAHPVFLCEDNAAELLGGQIDYIVDAVDRMPAKIALAAYADAHGIPIVMSMGAGNKLDPGGFAVMDLYKTRMDPLARRLRRELSKRGIRAVDVVCSFEKPLEPAAELPGEARAVGSIAFVPGAAGLMLAGHVVRRLAERAKG